MNFLEDILDYFDEEAASEGLNPDTSDIDMSFMDHGTDLDNEAINKIKESYNLGALESEEFLEITQSIQHSIGDELADVETLKNIDSYIDTFNADPERMVGLINNVKGIYGEHEVIEALKSQYTDGQVVLRDYATNAKDTDLKVFDDSGNLIEKIQVKVTNSPDYILETRENLPDDIKIITTDEVIEEIIARKGELPDGIEGIGLSCNDITADVSHTLNILNETEPEFDMLIHDPVIAEQLSYGNVNPFQEEQTFGRQVHADKRYNHPIRWVYSGPAEELGDMAGLEKFDLEWDPRDFNGVGDPIKEAQFFKPQESPVSCAIATQRNIIESLTGESLNEDELIKFASEKGIYNPQTGTVGEHLSTILKSKGFECVDINSGNISMIEGALREGDKVMIGIDAAEITNPLRSVISGAIAEQPDMLHCIQVTGIDYSDPFNVKVIMADPGDINGALKAVSMDDFMSSWEDANCRLTIVSKK